MANEAGIGGLLKGSLVLADTKVMSYEAPELRYPGTRTGRDGMGWDGIICTCLYAQL